MLDIKTAAAKAGVSPALVYAWTNGGSLPHYGLGKAGSRGTIRIAESDLDAFLQSLKHGREEPKESVPPAPKRKVILKHLRLKQS